MSAQKHTCNYEGHDEKVTQFVINFNLECLYKVQNCTFLFKNLSHLNTIPVENNFIKYLPTSHGHITGMPHTSTCNKYHNCPPTYGDRTDR